jgi:hypothetical protein
MTDCKHYDTALCGLRLPLLSEKISFEKIPFKPHSLEKPSFEIILLNNKKLLCNNVIILE